MKEAATRIHQKRRALIFFCLSCFILRSHFFLFFFIVFLFFFFSFASSSYFCILFQLFLVLFFSTLFLLWGRSSSGFLSWPAERIASRPLRRIAVECYRSNRKTAGDSRIQLERVENCCWSLGLLLTYNRVVVFFFIRLNTIDHFEILSSILCVLI